MENSTVRVILALASIDGRAVLRALLLEQLGSHQLEEVSDPYMMAIRVADFRPDLLLFDDRMLLHLPVRIMLATLPGQRPHHMMLVAMAPGALVDASVRYMVAVEYLDTPCTTVLDTIRACLSAPEPAQRRLALVPRDAVDRDHRKPVELPREPLSWTWPAERSQAGASPSRGTRHTLPATRQLVDLLHTTRQLPEPLHRGREVPLGTQLLADALRALPRANAPAAVLVLQLGPRLVPSQVTPDASEAALLQAVDTSLQGAVRRDDVIYRLASTTFAILLPGVTAHQSTGPITRLRGALEMLRCTVGDVQRNISLVIGLGFWEPGMAPSAPFEQGWQAMLADRMAQDGCG